MALVFRHPESDYTPQPDKESAVPVSGCLRYGGRDFPAAELDLIRALIVQRDPPLFRTALSRAVCAALDCRKPDGGLKEMSARVALLRMQRDGLLTLPPPLRTVPRPQPLALSPRTAPPGLAPLPVSLAQARPPCASPCCAPPIPAAASGTNSSSATTTSATSPCPAPNCATSCTPPTASCWPCSAAAPRPGKPPHATVSSAGMPPPASATCRCSSITPAISSCRRWLHNPTLATSLKNKDFLIRVPRQRTLSRPLSIPCHANPRLDPGNRTLAGHPDSILPTTLPS